VAPVEAQAGQAQTQAVQAQGTANEALQRANAAHKLAEGKFLYEVVLSDDSVKFPVNRNEVSPEAKARLDELVQKVKSENRNVYLEIQGFTDASGDASYNEKLGEARAEAVRRYLHRRGIALNRMATISYGEEDPAASNSTPQGRAQNRRVMIVVLI
jgi:outer membrane protein OmpA-like peptidoglycan-associated protein